MRGRGELALFLLYLMLHNGMPKEWRRAFATVITTPEYVQGAGALAASIRSSLKVDDHNDYGFFALAVVIDASPIRGLHPEDVHALSRFGFTVVPIEASSSVRCVPAGHGTLMRFASACSKLNLWSSLEGKAEQVLYLDADSMVLPAFDAAAVFRRTRHLSFAAKPTPPDSPDCGGEQARHQIRLLGDSYYSSDHHSDDDDGGGGGSDDDDAVFEAFLDGAQNATPSPLPLHPCHDLFQTNIFMFRPSKRTFRALRRALEALTLQYYSTALESSSLLQLRGTERSHGVGMIQERERIQRRLLQLQKAVAFDSGFLSRALGLFWAASPQRWLPFKHHLETTLARHHWPSAMVVARPVLGSTPETYPLQHPKSDGVAHFGASWAVNWSAVHSVDFSGPPNLKPWSILQRAPHRFRTEREPVAVEMARRTRTAANLTAASPVSFDQPGCAVRRGCASTVAGAGGASLQSRGDVTLLRAAAVCSAIDEALGRPSEKEKGEKGIGCASPLSEFLASLFFRWLDNYSTACRYYFSAKGPSIRHQVVDSEPMQDETAAIGILASSGGCNNSRVQAQQDLPFIQNKEDADSYSGSVRELCSIALYQLSADNPA